MKSAKKTPKKRPQKTTRATKVTKTAQKKVVLVHKRRRGLRHLRLINHIHSGKLTHVKHTSHVSLVIILLLVGAFLLAFGSNMSKALQSSNSVNVTAIVAGPPPDGGAYIYQPLDGDAYTDVTTVEVAGTCVVGTYVVINNNGINVGSVDCSDAGIFILDVQLWAGENVLTALNYDDLNQPGPATPSVNVSLTITPTPEPEPEPEPTPVPKPTPSPTEVKPPKVPTNPSIIPGVDTEFKDCNDYNPDVLNTGGNPHVTIACIPRIILPGSSQPFGMMIWGGEPPYALSVDWGDGSDRLLISQPTVAYKTLVFNYDKPGSYVITIQITDKDGKTASIQTAIRVSGSLQPVAATPIIQNLNIEWFLAPVPLYLLALAITFGFWAGDIFDRKFGHTTKTRRKKRA